MSRLVVDASVAVTWFLPEVHGDVALRLLDPRHDLLAPEPALEIALEFEHPVYDALYLALALRTDCKLVTADSRLYRRFANGPLADSIHWVEHPL